MNKLSFIIITGILSFIWGGMLIAKLLLPHLILNIDQFITSLYIPISLYASIIAIIIHKNNKEHNKDITLWLCLVIGGIFIQNLFWYSAVYIYNTKVNDAVFFIWGIPTTIFLYKVLQQNFLAISRQQKVIWVLAITDCITILLLLSSIHYSTHILLSISILRIIIFAILMLILNLIIMCVIYAENIAFTILLLSLMTLVSQTALFYMYNCGNELTWAFGILLNCFSVIMMAYTASYTPRLWIIGNSIKNELVCWCFSMSIISFLGFFMVAYAVSVISKSVFLGLPLYVMLYSVIIIVLSMYVGSHFTAPFKQLEDNIRSLMSDETIDETGTSFPTAEFTFLQQSIIESFKYRSDSNKMKHEFGILAASIADNLQSSIRDLTVSIYNLKNIEQIDNNNDDIRLMESSLQDVKNISSHLLNDYEILSEAHAYSNLTNTDNGNIPRYVILNLLLSRFLVAKRLEWQTYPCNLEYTIDTNAALHFSYIAPTPFLRMLSNLMNNAYQSLNKDNRNIQVHLLSQLDKLVLSIKDSGCGIAKERINAVMQGDSSKHHGKGIGLLNAQKYLDSIHGELTLKSKINHGTTVHLTIPITTNPTWFNANMQYTQDTSLVILPNNVAIIEQWQLLLANIPIEVNYFLSIDNFRYWYHTHNKKDVILFVDHDFHSDIYNQANGIDIITEFHHTHRYLVTEYAETLWLQDIALKSNFKLLPKELINSLQFIPISVPFT